MCYVAGWKGQNMLKLEEYIAKRKMEDGLNEFDTDKKMNNIRTSIDYIFEYYEQYLVLEGANNRLPEENEKLNKYEKALREYSPEIRTWFIKMYIETGWQVNKTIMKYCENTSGFFLTYEDSEFRAISYNCYAELVEKRPCLKGETEKLYQFIKEYHAIVTTREYINYGYPKISEKISYWIEETYEKYNVNISFAIDKYIDEFLDNIDMWPPRTRIKAEVIYPGHLYDYECKRHPNIFNINTFYSKYGSKPFIKGKKKSLIILILFKWDNKYLEEYLENCTDY